MKTKNLYGSIILLITAIIWGSTFLAQEMGGENLGPLTFNGIRFIIGGIVLLPVILFRTFLSKKKRTYTKETKQDKKNLFIGGTLAGLFLGIASFFQQGALGGIVGVEPSTPGKVAFISALYIIFVPIVGIFFKRRTPILIIPCLLLAIFGFYLLSVKEEIHIQTADILALVSSLGYSFQILLIDKYIRKCDCIKLSCVQFFVCGLFSLILMLFFEKPTFESIKLSIFPLLYTGILSCGIAYTLQSVGQKITHPTIATLLMSLESVFSMLFSVILNFEKNAPTTKEFIGCIIIFVAVIVGQFIPIKIKRSDYETR